MRLGRYGEICLQDIENGKVRIGDSLDEWIIGVWERILEQRITRFGLRKNLNV
ncbi:MAG: hypothetical protein IJ599_04120 [Alphaproteobacteria bacterium]|nr:hypothetical protein [Alphaproteobacteria bacterium]